MQSSVMAMCGGDARDRGHDPIPFVYTNDEAREVRVLVHASARIQDMVENVDELERFAEELRRKEVGT